MKSRWVVFLVVGLSLLTAGVVYAATISTVTVDDAGGGPLEDVGYYTSLAVNSSGNAVIAYYDRNNTSLKIAFCNNKECSSPTIKTLNSSVGNQGTFTSLVLDASGNPVISYYSFGPEALHLLRCLTPQCDAVNDFIVEAGAGSDTSLVLRPGGFATISYYDGSPSPGVLKLAYCTALDCSTSTITTVDTGANDVGRFTSMALNSSGHPVIAYYDLTAGNLKLATCSAADCSGAISIVPIDSGGWEGVSLQLDSASRAVIAYHDLSNRWLKLAHCNSAACDAPIINVVDDSAQVGQYVSLKLDGGLPVMSYYDEFNGNLKLARCADPNCASASAQVVDSAGNVGWDTSLQLGSAYISYYDESNSALKFAFVPDAAAVATPPPAAQRPAALPATGFAPDRANALPAGRVEYASTQIELAIPALGVQTTVLGVPLADGHWDVSWLGGQVGHLAGTAWPTWAGNSVLTGHVWDADNTPGVFAGLNTLKHGDRVELRADGRTYTYEVRNTQLVSPKNLSLLNQNDGYSWITLLTCELYNPLSGEYFFRRAVSAVLVSVE